MLLTSESLFAPLSVDEPRGAFTEKQWRGSLVIE